MGIDERHYKQKDLYRVFAVVAVILLIAVIAMFAKDYSRRWKTHQEKFRRIQIEKTYAKYDSVSKKLESDPKYTEILASVTEEEKKYKANCSGLKNVSADIKNLESNNLLVDQKYKFAKSNLDAAKYRFETGQAHPTPDIDANKAKTDFKKFTAEVLKYKLELEKINTAISGKQSILDACGASLKSVQKERDRLAKQKTQLEKKLKKTDPTQMSIVNQIAVGVRDLPVIDLANPNNKIDQIVLKDIQDNVNFLTVPKVERCTTCHLGIANPDYKNDAQPFKAHPHLDKFVGNDSLHPLEEFGCTSCHGGRGRGTDFNGAAHTPQNEEQQKRWEKKYHWGKMELWEEPMFPLQYTEAGCFKCHNHQTTIKGADTLTLGLNIIERAGCYNCHAMDTFKNWPKTGPDLTNIISKSPKNWAFKWIENPEHFHSGTFMPSFFHQDNNSDPESIKRSQQEIHAILQYLYAKSEDFKLTPLPVEGDGKHGEELVASVGCFGCHNMDEKSERKTRDRNDLKRQFGPSLANLGSKTSKEWLFQWLKDPYSYHAESRMPNLRLSDQEAADIATFLSQPKDEKIDALAVPDVNDAVLNDVVTTFLLKNDTHDAVVKKLSQMSQDDKLMFAGEKLIGQYGCYSCHNIKGFENVKPIGADLNQEGNKSTHKLDFGFVHMEHSNYAWFKQKLLNPRIFDEKKVKAADEKLLMPNFNFTEEEAEAVTTAVLGLVDNKGVKRKMFPRTPENIQIEKGQALVAQFNCQGCHLIEGEGGAIKNRVADWLVKYQEKDPNDAQAMATSFSPPNLIGEGQKVQADWLFKFIHDPSTPIRPWLKVRMPTYKLNAGHLNALLKYFNALDKQEFPFVDQADTSMSADELDQVQKLFSKENFDCASCHIVGNQMPSGTPDRWAPNFALAKERLKPEWIIKWLLDPAALLPGTKMPTYFDPNSFNESGPPNIFNGDENIQIRMLRNYLLTISEHPMPMQPPTPAPAPAASEEPSEATETSTPQAATPAQ